LWYLIDGAVFGTPVVAATKVWGPWPAFLLFSVVYTAAGAALAVFAVHLQRRRQARLGAPDGRVARWLDSAADDRRSLAFRGLVRGGSIVGFLVASLMLGGALTMWFWSAAGRKGPVVLLSVLSSSIIAVWYAAVFSGAGALLF
jgi:hypothetical protein